MAISVSLQKRKRADSTLDSIIVLTIAEEAVIQATIDERHGKPSNIEDNSYVSNIEPSNKVELKIRRSFGFSGSFLLVVMRRLFWRSL
jgi:3-oxoacyl-(acyl-carrier-protein) synthase